MDKYEHKCEKYGIYFQMKTTFYTNIDCQI